jgi:hypothetical protein
VYLQAAAEEAQAKAAKAQAETLETAADTDKTKAETLKVLSEIGQQAVPQDVGVPAVQGATPAPEVDSRFADALQRIAESQQGLAEVVKALGKKPARMRVNRDANGEMLGFEPEYDEPQPEQQPAAPVGAIGE